MKVICKTLENVSKALENFCKQQQVTMASIDVTQDYVAALVKLFKVRGKQGKAA